MADGAAVRGRRGRLRVIHRRRQSELDKAVATVGRHVTALQGDLADLGTSRSYLFATVKSEEGEGSTWICLQRRVHTACDSSSTSRPEAVRPKDLAVNGPAHVVPGSEGRGGC